MTSLTITLGILQLLDWFTTRTILKAGGYEQNPVMAKLFQWVGVDIGLLVKGGVVLALGYWLGTQNTYVLAGLDIFYVFVIIHNMKSL